MGTARPTQQHPFGLDLLVQLRLLRVCSRCVCVCVCVCCVCVCVNVETRAHVGDESRKRFANKMIIERKRDSFLGGIRLQDLLHLSVCLPVNHGREACDVWLERPTRHIGDKESEMLSIVKPITQAVHSPVMVVYPCRSHPASVRTRH